jgi:flavin-dependent thymidylate synthase
MTDNELPGMWQESDLSGGEADGWSNSQTHRDPYRGTGLRGPATSPEAVALEEADRRLPVRMADSAQYAREAIPEEQRGQIRVRLLNAMPDPYGSVAALCAQYSGKVVRDLSDVTDEERRAVIDDMLSTVLNGPLEVAQFHFQIEGVTRSITHQMVRSRASFFAQESLRFAVPEGDWRDEIPYPPALSLRGDEKSMEREALEPGRQRWREAMMHAQYAYQDLIDMGLPAEEARGVLPHDMPTRIHWVLDLRTLLTEAGKRTCTQAQFPWRMIFAGMAKALREYTSDWNPEIGGRTVSPDAWQFADIANRLRPVCFQTGQCGFMAKFDRNCSIRERVDANARFGRPSSEWGNEHVTGRTGFRVDILPWARRSDGAEIIPAIYDREWAADPGAARS